ncbi:SPOR domain-containing protein [Erythrobacteraceae bacterium WH01K]|nr:SPOR domain-containing protein [Erythrobacteraceae bacterium WH01K]
MIRKQSFTRLALTSAVATVALAGCTSAGGQRADLAASDARTAIASGEAQAAVASAESAVAQEPRNATYRAVLGAAYLDAGRFQSAATGFEDAITLGDTSPRTALGYSLALIGAGDQNAALGVLEDWRDSIPAADRGLALALAGDADRGVHVLASTLRAGNNTAKVRQNLAYAYALQGNWRAARVMAAEDVPGDMLDARLSEWAKTSTGDAHRERVAALLNVPVRRDGGMPAALALNVAPGAEQQMAEAAAMAPALAEAFEPKAVPATASASRELPPLAEIPAPRGDTEPARAAAQPVSQAVPQVAAVVPPATKPESFEDAFAAPAPQGATVAQIARSAIEFVTSPVVQTMPVRNGAKPEPVRKVAAQASIAGGDSHLVQLGSFNSEAGAKRAWGIYAQRYSQLSDHQMVITKARVRGKIYYRVSAAGFDNAGARSMCSSVKSNGQGCITWARNAPLPGAIDTGVRMASR